MSLIYIDQHRSYMKRTIGCMHTTNFSACQNQQCTAGTQGTLNQIFKFENRDLIYLHEIFWMFAGYLPALEYVIRYL